MTRTILLIIILFLGSGVFAQLENLTGIWISDQNELLKIEEKKNTSKRGEYSGVFNKTLYIDRDARFYLDDDLLTISTMQFSSKKGEDPTSSYSFIISKHTEKELILKPCDKDTKKEFKARKKLRFTKQEYIINPKFGFEKIVYNSSMCYGLCPILWFTIYPDRKVEFSATYFKDFGVEDEEKSGDFVGYLDVETFDSLIKSLVQARLETFDYYPEKDGFDLCCDGSIGTLNIYHNGDFNYHNAMFFPEIYYPFLRSIYSLSELPIYERSPKEINHNLKIKK